MRKPCISVLWYFPNSLKISSTSKTVDKSDVQRLALIEDPPVIITHKIITQGPQSEIA